MKCFDGTDWKGTKVGEHGGYLRSYEGELRDFAGAVLDGTAPAATAEYTVVSCGSRTRCTGRRRRSAGRRSGHEQRDVRLRRYRVLVTGATSGIGATIAAFIAAGAAVTIAGTRAGAGDYDVDLGGFTYRQCRMTEPDDIAASAATLPRSTCW